MYLHPEGRGKRRGPMPPGLFLFFIIFHFFGGHLPQTSGFRSAKQILVVSFATQARACILSDRKIFTPRGEGQQRRGLMPLGLFLFLSCESLIYNSGCCVFLWDSRSFFFLDLASEAITLAIMKSRKSLNAPLLCGFPCSTYVIFKLIVRSYSSCWLVVSRKLILMKCFVACKMLLSPFLAGALVRKDVF